MKYGRSRRLAYTTGLLMRWGYRLGLDGTPWACLGSMMGIWHRQQIIRCLCFAGRRPRCRRAGRSAVCCCYKSHNWWQRLTSRRIRHRTGIHTVTAVQQNLVQGPQVIIKVHRDYSIFMDIYRVNFNHIPCVSLLCVTYKVTPHLIVWAQT